MNMALARKLYKNISLKSGEVLKRGSEVRLVPHHKEGDRLCVALINGKEHVLRWSSVIRPPSMECLMRQEMDGVCDSIRGCRVEPDGHDEQGYPSWLLALGVI